MLRYGLSETGRFAAGLLGALLLAATISAMGAQAGFAAALLARAVSLLRLDFGASALTGAPALGDFAQHLAPTLQLLGGGAALALVAGVPLGLALNSRRMRALAAPVLEIAASAPVFCAGLALLWIAHRMGWDVSAATGASFWPALLQGDSAAASRALPAFGLPALVVGAAGAASVLVVVRRGAHAAMAEPYRETLRLMGLGAFEIDRLYLAPRLLAGLCAGLGQIVLTLFAATAVAEWVFAWPGEATLFIHSVALGDWNVAAAVLFAFAVLALATGYLGMLAAHALGER
ncbi:MAG: ABC transporter permease subunit [Rhizomicrobium sp.]